jgi:hypothetical protein
VQCAIPAFEGLFPEPYNTSILTLLFLCSHWHGLAKLRSHMDATLDIFDDITVETGRAFRHFANNTCNDFDTRELNREEEQRKRREAKRRGGTRESAAPGTPLESTSHEPNAPTPLTAPSDPTPTPPLHVPTPQIMTHATPGTAASLTPGDKAVTPDITPQASDPGKDTNPSIPSTLPATRRTPPPSARPKFAARRSGRRKIFSLYTYKYHALGDYPRTIRRYGTTDSYSTQIVCVLLHTHHSFFFILLSLG